MLFSFFFFRQLSLMLTWLGRWAGSEQVLVLLKRLLLLLGRFSSVTRPLFCSLQCIGQESATRVFMHRKKAGWGRAGVGNGRAKL